MPGTGNNGEPEFAHLLFGPSFISHELHHTGRGADKLDAAGFTHFGEMRAFGEVAVAGMDRIHISNFSSANDTGDVEVAVLTPGRPNAKGFVSKNEREESGDLLQSKLLPKGFAVPCRHK